MVFIDGVRLGNGKHQYGHGSGQSQSVHICSLGWLKLSRNASFGNKSRETKIACARFTRPNAFFDRNQPSRFRVLIGDTLMTPRAFKRCQSFYCQADTAGIVIVGGELSRS
jgi:hypothetical protein